MSFFDDGFLDSIKQSAQGTLAEIGGQFGQTLANSTRDALVRVGGDPGGNRTAEEIAAGASGSRVELRPASADAGSIFRSIGDRSINIGGASVSPLMIAGGAVLAYFAYKAIKRGR